MKSPHNDYLKLLRSYLSGAITGEELQRCYLEMFKTEDRAMSEKLFGVLDEVFGDIDSYCPDPILLAELRKQRGNWHLDDEALRVRVENAVQRIEAIGDQS